MRITCPHCGARDAQEFTYLGDASVQRPVTPVEQPIDDQVLDVWHDYVYLRENPAGELRELWYHGGGCHQWLVVTRNVRTHEISGPAVPAASARARS
ncbi:MAG: sarcosine oxidase subunit delta [Hyphomicrobiaceae bacterium]